MPGFGYGYQWWTYPGGYGAQGIFGQSITIVPEEPRRWPSSSNWPDRDQQRERRANGSACSGDCRDGGRLM